MSNSTPDKAVKKMKDLGHIYTGLFKRGDNVKLNKFIKQWRERNVSKFVSNKNVLG